MGMNFEKFGSRPGSRRTSMSEPRQPHVVRDHDDETAAITAANQILTKPVSSEAPTSPTLHEFPVKSNTLPASYHPHFDEDDQTTTVSSSRRQSFYSAHDELSRQDSHVPTVATDVHAPLTGGRIVDSPVDDMRELHRDRDLASKPSVGPNGSPAVTTRSLEGPSGVPPTSPFGDEASYSAHGETTLDGSSAPRRSFQWADELPSGAQSPHYAPKVSMDEEIPPGRGTKRMFKLSKRFSKLHMLVTRSPQTPALSAKPGPRSRTLTSWTTSAHMSSTPRTTHSQLRSPVGVPTDCQAITIWPTLRMPLGLPAVVMPSARCSFRRPPSTPGRWFEP